MEQKNKTMLAKCSEWIYIIIIKCSERNIGSEVNRMKLNKHKYELAMARACMSAADIEKYVPKGTVCRLLGGAEARPNTLGKLAKALGVDVTEIIETEK